MTTHTLYKVNRNGKRPYVNTFSYQGIMYTDYTALPIEKGDEIRNFPVDTKRIHVWTTVQTISRHGIIYLAKLYQKSYF